MPGRRGGLHGDDQLSAPVAAQYNAWDEISRVDLFYIYIYIILYIYRYIILYVCMCLSIYLSSYLSICLSIDLSIYLYLSIFIYLSLSIIIYLSICMVACFFSVVGKECGFQISSRKRDARLFCSPYAYQGSGLQQVSTSRTCQTGPLTYYDGR